MTTEPWEGALTYAVVNAGGHLSHDDRDACIAVHYASASIREALIFSAEADTLARRRRILGDHHPQTLTSASNLADDLEQLGDHHAAGALRAEVKQRRSGQGEAAPDIGP